MSDWETNLGGWADRYIKELNSGVRVSFRPKGHSMTPRIKNEQLCVVEPADWYDIEKDMIVLCTVKGYQYVHLVTAVKGDQYQISNNKGHINGWISRDKIYGVLHSVHD